MFTLGDLNLDGLISDFVNNLIENDDTENDHEKIELYKKFQSKKLIDAFNSRNITPENINQIILICDYLMIQNTESFLRSHVQLIFDKNIIIHHMN